MKDWKRQIAAVLAICIIATSTPVVRAVDMGVDQVVVNGDDSGDSSSLDTPDDTEVQDKAIFMNGQDVFAEVYANAGGGITAPDAPLDTATARFVGWSMEKDQVEATTVFEADHTYYAIWKEVEATKEFTITFNANGGKLNDEATMTTVDGKLSSLLETTREGYTFKGWFTDLDFQNPFVANSTTVTADTTLYAKWEAVAVAETFTVTFMDDTKTLGTAKVTDGNTVTVPSGIIDPATGFAFDGWYSDKALTTPFSTNDEVIKADTILYAKWKAVDTAYFYDGDTWLNTVEVDKGGTLEAPKDPTKDNYTFGGWSATSGGTEKVTSFENGKYYFAIWTAIDTSTGVYTITFNANGGTLTGATTMATVGGKLPSLPSNPTRDGYIFDGWYNMPDVSSVATKMTTESNFLSDKTIYAQWDDGIDKITISEKPDKVSYKTGDKIDPDGLEIIVTLDTKETATVVYDDDTEDDFDFSPSLTTSLKSSHETLTVIYKGDHKGEVAISVAEADMSVTVDVEDHDGDIVTGASIKLLQGSTTKYTATDNKDGTYTFPAVNAGTYNMTLTYDDHVRSSVVTVSSNDVDAGTITLTAQPLITLVNDNMDTNVLTVGGLDDLALSLMNDDNEIITVSMDFDDYVTAAEQDLIMMAKDADQRIAQIFDVSLEMHRAYSDSTKEETEDLSELDDVVSFTFEIDEDYQDRSSYSIFRNHGDEVDEITTSKNSNGEYITVDDETVTVYTRYFSTYALAVNAVASDEDEDYVSSIKPLAIIKMVNGEETTLDTAGTVVAEKMNPVYGDRVYFTVTAKTGYTVASMSAVDSEGNAITILEFSDGRFYYTQLANPVEITVKFIGTTETTAPSTYGGFSDISSNAYYYYHVYRCKELGLMDGTASGIFEPDTVTTRAMVATILFNMAGSPNFYGQATFSDVADGDWFATPVMWAKSAGVISGYEDNTFRPDAPVTREEIALMFYKFAQYAGVHTGTTYVATYSDFSSVGSWAQTAVSWCTYRGLFSGYDGNIYAPGATSRRCDVAVSLVALHGLL